MIRGSGRVGERGLGQERKKPVRLEQVAPDAALRQFELLEDRRRIQVAGLGRLAPFGLQPLAALDVAVVGIEDLTDIQLRRDRAVPLVGLELERDVVVPDPAEPVDLPAESKRDRTAGVAAVLAHPETQVLDRKSTRLNSSHVKISYAVFFLKKKKKVFYYFIIINIKWKNIINKSFYIMYTHQYIFNFFSFFIRITCCYLHYLIFFFFNDTATTEIYTLSLHDALPIAPRRSAPSSSPGDRPAPSTR